jgi:hypothetical protein
MPTARQAPFLDLAKIHEVLRAANRAAGLSAINVGAWYGVERLLSHTDKKPHHLRAATILIAILVAAVPFCCGQIIPKIPQGAYQVAVIILGLILTSSLVYLSIVFPKDLLVSNLQIELIRSNMVTSNLAGQLALHNFVQEIFTSDDQDTIDQFSELLNESAKAKLMEAEKDVLKLLFELNDNGQSSSINLVTRGLSSGLRSTLANIARSVANACSEIFNSGSFVVKIYVRTSHSIPLMGKGDTKVDLLTAVGRYPSKTEGAEPFSGKSWIKCKGVCSDVWNTVVTGQPQVFRNVPAERNGHTYKSIACIPLPQGLGAVTIESSQYDTFTLQEHIGIPNQVNKARIPLSEHRITEELRTSIAVAVKTLVVRAVKADCGK